jgi:hypothetical protein
MGGYRHSFSSGNAESHSKSVDKEQYLRCLGHILVLNCESEITGKGQAMVADKTCMYVYIYIYTHTYIHRYISTHCIICHCLDEFI